MAWIYRPNHPKANANGMVERSQVYQYRENSAPHVISDTMEPVKHMGTGRVMDSKSKFRAETRASGCVEIGNEAIKPRQQIKLDGGQRRDAIRKAIYYLKNRR
jgi:hypothetical protein